MKVLLVLVLMTSFLMDAPVVESMLVQAYGPYAVLTPRYRAASLEFCVAIEHFQPPFLPTPFGGTPMANPRVGEPLPLTDIKTCQPSLTDLLVQAMRLPIVPWPVPFIVSPQQ